MTKLGPQEGPCGWLERPAPTEIEDLHKILNCASHWGCSLCVRCSERALDHLQHIARTGRSVYPPGLERLELDMELASVFGL